MVGVSPRSIVLVDSHLSLASAAKGARAQASRQPSLALGVALPFARRPARPRLALPPLVCPPPCCERTNAKEARHGNHEQTQSLREERPVPVGSALHHARRASCVG